MTFLRKLWGDSSRLRAAEETHSKRVSEIEEATAGLEALKKRLGAVGVESQREGNALAQVLAEVHVLPLALPNDGTKP